METSRYWIYTEVIEVLGKIGGEEAEKVLHEIVSGDFHHEETKEEATEQLKKLKEKQYLDNLPTLEEFFERTED